jgi:hypothetical protein
MSRRTAVVTVAGALLLGGLAGPAVAGPVDAPTGDRETVCVRTDNGEDGVRKGVCVWVPIHIPLVSSDS